VDTGFRRTSDGWVEPVGRDSPYAWDEFGAFRFGERNLLDNALLPDGDGQLVVGLELWGHPAGGWLDFEVGFWASAPWNGSLDDWADSISGYPDEEIIDPEASAPFVQGSSTLEFSVGLRKEFWLLRGHLRPFVSGGASALRARTFAAQGADGEEDSDGVLGWYGQVGVGWMFLNGSRIDVSYRTLDTGEISVGGIEGDADYDQWSVGFGFSF
jgi:hypothetical protein